MIRRYKYTERNVVPDLLLTMDEDYSNELETKLVYSSGSFSYRYINEWAKLPEHLWGHVISGICCDSHDNIFITMRCKQAPILKLDSNGKLVKSFGEKLPFAKLHGISIAKDETVWVTDDTNHVAFHLDQNGKLLGQIGKLGVPSDSGYRTDYVDPSDKTEPVRIKVYDKDGVEHEKLISNSAYKSIKCMAPPFNKPTKLIPHGNCLYASDGYGNTAVHVFDKDGNLQRSWGGPGKGRGEFSIVHSVWIDLRERIWVCDRENDRVQVFTLDGELLHVINKLWSPVDVWSDDKHVYILQNDGKLGIYSMNYRLLAEIGHWQCGNMVAHSLTGDSKGNLYLADCGVKGVFKLEKITQRGFRSNGDKC